MDRYNEIFLCHDVCYNFRIKKMSGSSLPTVVVRGLMSYLCYLCLFAYSGDQHTLTIWVTLRVAYKSQELLALYGSLGSPLVFGGVHLAHLHSFLCYVFCFVCLRLLSYVPNVASFFGLSIQFSLTLISKLCSSNEQSLLSCSNQNFSLVPAISWHLQFLS